MYITIKEAEHEIASHVDAILLALSTENKYGSKYVCQLHDDKDASLHVYKDDNNVHLHCFGCGFHGSIFDYVAKLKGIGKIEAADWCLKTAGINRSVMMISQDDVTKLAELNKYIALLLHKSTEHLNKDAVEFLKSKGLYDRKLLSSACIGQINSTDQLMQAAIKKYGREFIDKMRPINLALFGPNKLTYTIFNRDGKPVAFAARKLDGTLPKYVNSNGNVYDKRVTPYGIHRVVSGKELIVVEGYNDALAFWSLGIRNAIALCGTSFSNELVDLLVSLQVPRIHLFFDSDNAGLKASYESIMKLANTNIKTDVWLASCDPDELILRHGKDFMKGVQVQSNAEFVLYYTQDPEFTINSLELLAGDDIEQTTISLCETLRTKFGLDYNPYKLLYETIRKKYERELGEVKSQLTELTQKVDRLVNYGQTGE